MRLWDKWGWCCGFAETSEISSTNLPPSVSPSIYNHFPIHDTDYATKAQAPCWQFPRQNNICGNTNNISIKNLSQNPLRFPRKADRFRKEGNSGLPRGKMSSSVMGDGVLNEWAGHFHDCAMSWETLTQISDLSLKNRTKKNVFHWQTTPSVLLTRAQ